MTPTERHLFTQGKDLFERVWTPEEGLGPHFNNRSCGSCHKVPATGGIGASYNAHLRLGRIDEDGIFRTLPGYSSGVLQEAAVYGASILPVPPQANAFSRRDVPPLFGLGLVEAIPDEQIIALADRLDEDGDGISGRVPFDSRGVARRFGAQCQSGSLHDFTLGAFSNDMGLEHVELPTFTEDLIAVFVRYLAPVPRGSINDDVQAGQDVFAAVGCAGCHTPSFTLPDTPYTTADGLVIDSNALRDRTISPYSDFLLHDMGAELDDGVAVPGAKSSEYRTTPLWGLRLRGTYLHDGRARDLGTAILLHGGEAAEARHGFRDLIPVERDQLVQFLRSL